MGQAGIIIHISSDRVPLRECVVFFGFGFGLTRAPNCRPAGQAPGTGGERVCEGISMNPAPYPCQCDHVPWHALGP